MNRFKFFLLALCLGSVWLIAQLAPATQAGGPGTPLWQLTEERGIDARAAWSPDNRTIAYQSFNEGQYHIYLMNADGTNKRALTKGTNDDRHPIWSADGKTIFYDSFDGTSREIFSVNVADASVKQLTRTGALASFPSPSPDGKSLTFYVYKDDVLNLWRARIDGSDAKPLTQKLASASANQCTFPCHHAGWSEDSRDIVYSAGELDTIWMISGENGAPQKIIDNGEDNHFPWFLPDGRIGYVIEHIEATSAWTDFWAFDLKSGQHELLQERMAMQGPVVWNNDYTKLLFHSPRGGNFDIYLIDLNVDGGLDALHGKTTRAERVPTASASTAPLTTTTQADARAENNSMLIIGSVAGVVIGLAGILVFALRPHKK